jgi:NADPH:quinone reductase-like Zn-dependent oxidoreductase
VLIRVAATSFNGVDGNIRAGFMQGPIPVTLPHTPGIDVSGTIAGLGEGVDRFEVGDRVIGFLPMAGDGAAAEYVVAPSEILAPAPTTVPLVDAAALPTVGLTAWQALFDHAKLTAGQRVLINGAGGAVGGYAVQLAKNAGAYVIATAGPRSSEQAKAAGADEVIDHTTTAVTWCSTWRRSNRHSWPRCSTWSARAACWSTPRCGCPLPATSSAAYAASTCSSAATPTS